MSLPDELRREIRYTARGFRREPAFVAGVVLTFALAIGANTSMFGLVEWLMLAPPPGIQDAGRVVRIHQVFAGEQGASFTLSTTSYPAFRAIEALGSPPGQALAAVAAVRADTMTTGRGAELSEVAAVQASGRYFTALGVQPALGRLFGPGDDVFPTGNDVVVLGYAYWRRRFAGEPGAIGGQLVVNDRPLTIIGVAPRGFNGTELTSTDVFVPLTTAFRNEGAGWFNNEGMHVVSVVARLHEGTSATAAGEMVASALREQLTGQMGNRLTSVTLESLVPGQSARQSSQARIALWLSGVSLVVLLIATANVGTLLVLRSARRRRDVATRITLGASHARLVRQALVESVALSLMGAAGGLLLARWFDGVVRATLLPNLAPSDRVVDGKVLVSVIVAASVAGMLAALGPIVQLGRRDLSAELRVGGGHGSSGRFLLQHALVAVQMALCVVLLIGAGLFVHSLLRVQSQDLGFSTARLLYVSLDFHGALSGFERDLAHEDAARRIETVRGVTGVTVVQGMPFSSHHIPPINIPGHPLPPPSVQQLPIMYGATPRYLTMMGVVLREGRLISDRDGRGAPLVVLVNETMARTVWPGERAIGQCVRAGYPPSFTGDPMEAVASTPCREVVGVVRDSRARSLRLEGDEDKLMQYYVPFGQLPAPPVPDFAQIHGILVQTAGEPGALAPSLQRIVQGTSAIPLFVRARPYQELIDPQLRSWRLGATLFSTFGALALGIAAVGLFAVVSYIVSQRTQEIGVRLALGGTAAGVARLVVVDALHMVTIGAALGGVVALAVAPLAQSMLFQTSARESASVIVAAATLLVVTIGAAAIPAWRASQVSPMTALRTDA